MSQRGRQCAGTVFMVRPARFGFNAQTAASNPLQVAGSIDAAAARAANDEFTGLAQALQSEGIRTVIGADTSEPAKPDAIFPNNWVSFHADGTVVLYPMLAPNRRLERRSELVEQVCRACDFQPRRTLDLAVHEQQRRFLEGTGSMVLDHVARVVYACRSPRTDAELVLEWAKAMQFDAVVFDAADANGQPYYHTNVMMWIGSRSAMVCTESIAPADRERVLAALNAGERELIEIDRSAVQAFAGNMLEIATWDEALGDSSVLVMSSTARAALPDAVINRLRGCVDTILAVPVPTIERVGGGSVRCMLTEVPDTAS